MSQKESRRADEAGWFDYFSPDGTRIRGWRNGNDGLPVVLSNGLGTPPSAWPGIIGDPALRVVTWFYRGTGGGSRPADRSRVRIPDHCADLIALMDGEGIERAVLVAWSVGVGVGVETTWRHPERVAGVLAVAGVPGGTFDAVGAALPGRAFLPSRLSSTLGIGVTRLLRRAGPLLNLARPLVPANRLTAGFARAARIVSSEAAPEVVVPALQDFLRHDWSWYFELALGAADHEPMDLSFLPPDLPVAFVAGRRDLLTSSRTMVSTARQLPQARVRILPGSHFLPLEFPGELRETLQELLDETDLASESGVA
jgi:pimeloyl-ACP methyl ester carboxylesterase